MLLGAVDWTGLGAFVTSIATLIGVVGSLIRGNSLKRQIRDDVAPRVEEMHDVVVNGSSSIPKDAPRITPPLEGTEG